MKDEALTQEAIDSGPDNEGDQKSGLFKKAAEHPFITGGVMLAGAGLAYAAVKLTSQAGEVARDVHIETSVCIDKSPAELFAFWRNFENLPRFMKNLESVSRLGNGRSHWVAKGLAGSRVEWQAEIYNEIPDELIAWRSLDNADITNAGSVRFERAPAGHGTYVRVNVNYNPPGGKVGASLAQLFGAEPKQLIREDLRRLKQIMEAGEIASIDGQTSGRDESATAIPTENGEEEAASVQSEKQQSSTVAA
jgi:uncharacterized membrane protein